MHLISHIRAGSVFPIPSSRKVSSKFAPPYRSSFISQHRKLSCGCLLKASSSSLYCTLTTALRLRLQSSVSGALPLSIPMNSSDTCAPMARFSSTQQMPTNVAQHTPPSSPKPLPAPGANYATLVPQISNLQVINDL